MAACARAGAAGADRVDHAGQGEQPGLGGDGGDCRGERTDVVLRARRVFVGQGVGPGGVEVENVVRAGHGCLKGSSRRRSGRPAARSGTVSAAS
jgi:hypothetical protein